MIKIIVLLTSLSVIGCGTARLVSTRYTPIKSGTVKLEGEGPAGRSVAQSKARTVMEEFCRPLYPKITGTDEVSAVNGAYASPFIRGAVNYDYSNSPLVHFECVGRDEIELNQSQKPASSIDPTYLKN